MNVSYPVCRIFKMSPNLEARKLYEITSTKHVNSDSIINKTVTDCRKIFIKTNNEKNMELFHGIKATKQLYSVNHNP